MDEESQLNVHKLPAGNSGLYNIQRSVFFKLLEIRTLQNPTPKSTTLNGRITKRERKKMVVSVHVMSEGLRLYDSPHCHSKIIARSR